MKERQTLGSVMESWACRDEAPAPISCSANCQSSFVPIWSLGLVSPSSFLCSAAIFTADNLGKLERESQ